MNWNDYFRILTHTIKLKSKDKKSQIGVLIVGEDNEIISTGYNSFPRGLNDDLPERQERPEKYHWFEHAERNAIYNAARIGVSTKGCKLYMSHWFPCMECARAIVQSGITTVYCDPLDEKAKNPRYNESFIKSKQLLEECGIKVIFYKDL